MPLPSISKREVQVEAPQRVRLLEQRQGNRFLYFIVGFRVSQQTRLQGPLNGWSFLVFVGLYEVLPEVSLLANQSIGGYSGA